MNNSYSNEDDDFLDSFNSENNKQKCKQTDVKSCSLLDFENISENIIQTSKKLSVQKQNAWDLIPEAFPVVDKDKNYSIEPDMINGWRPKKKNIFVKGPIPLQFSNSLVDSIIDKLMKCKQQQYQTNQFSGKSYNDKILCYIGERPGNQYEYFKMIKEQFQNNQFSFNMQSILFNYGSIYEEYEQNRQKQNIKKADQFKNFGNNEANQNYLGELNFITNTRSRKRQVPFIGQNPQIVNKSIQSQKQYPYQKECLLFDSRFESGNLDLAVRVGEYEYDLFMRVDSNSRGHTHWYLFSVANAEQGQTYKFNIKNFRKNKSLYERGMKPFVFSKRHYFKSQKQWNQEGDRVSYTPSTFENFDFLEDEYGVYTSNYFTLQFEYVFSEYDDHVMFSYSIPYNYSKLQNLVENINEEGLYKDMVKCEVLCKSLCGLDIPLLSITNYENNNENECIEQNNIEQNKHSIPIEKRSIIVIQGRIHPGESNGSWVMQGLIQELLSNSPQMQDLRSRIIFKIVPMINPDGVVMGNYRTGGGGKDLNRLFLNKGQDYIFYPSIQGLIKLMKECKQGSQQQKQQKILMFLDLHGHSQRKNVFIYGPNFPIYDINYIKCRLFPKILAQNTEMFSCQFKITPGKEKTARAAIIKDFQIANSFTIETSNGSYFAQQQNFLFSLQDWEKMGSIISQSLAQYIDQLTQLQQILEERRLQRHKQKINNIKFNQRTKSSLRNKSNAKKLNLIINQSGAKEKQFSLTNIDFIKELKSKSHSAQKTQKDNRDNIKRIANQSKGEQLSINNISLQKTNHQKNQFNIEEILQGTAFEDMIKLIKQDNQDKQENESDHFSREGSDSEKSDEDLAPDMYFH